MDRFYMYILCAFCIVAGATSARAGVFKAPDGTYVGGLPNLSPRGAYVGGTPAVTPDGFYTDGFTDREKFKDKKDAPKIARESSE